MHVWCFIISLANLFAYASHALTCFLAHRFTMMMHSS
uniref:Uncharacterized protein n=1 Tax=Rhizophora mucronata TaxID=61149 RepID=A0A2P2Q3U4_RHIMU